MEQIVIDAYKSFGLDAQEVKGNSRWGEHMVAIVHDGVQYALDHHGHTKGGLPDIEGGIEHLKIIQKLNHHKVKSIYQYLMAQGMGDIWVMSGGGSQVQAFFGNSSGYVAILYLDNEKRKVTAKEHVLQVQSAQNDKYFNGKISQLDISGVKVSTYQEAYGKNEEFDEEYDLIYNQ